MMAFGKPTKQSFALGKYHEVLLHFFLLIFFQIELKTKLKIAYNSEKNHRYI